MRYILTIIFCLLASCAGAYTNGFMASVASGGAVPYCTASACVGCSAQERFECGAVAGSDDSDQELAWTYSSGANANDACTSPIPFLGSESLCLQSASTATSGNIIPATDGDVFVALALQPALWSETITSPIELLTSGGISRVRFTLSYNASSPTEIDIVAITAPSGGTAYTTNIANAGNARYWQLQYNNSSGASDGVAKLWYSNDGTNWTLVVNYTTHNITDQVTKIKLNGTTGVLAFKDIRSSGSFINY